MNNLTAERLQHCLTVGRKMQIIAKCLPNCPYSPEDMFYLGVLHDIAYEFVDTQMKHELVGGEILKCNNYKYWKEIYFHGMPDPEYDSLALDILNYADLTTDYQGKDVTIANRLIDIATRYGENSIQYKNATILSEKLKNKFNALIDESIENKKTH